MPRNITITVPDDLASKMEKLPEVNWSAAARECLERYVQSRQRPDLAPILEKIRKESGVEYAVGVQKAREIAEKHPYRRVGGAWRIFLVREDELRHDKVPTGESMTDAEGKEAHIVREPTELDFLNLLEQVLVEHALLPALQTPPQGEGEEHPSKEYLRGLRDTLAEILESPSNER